MIEAVGAGLMAEEAPAIEMIEVVATGTGGEATLKVRGGDDQGRQDPVPDLHPATEQLDYAHQDRTSFKEVVTQRTLEYSWEASPCK